MRIGVRIVLVSAVFGLAVAIAGCKGVTPPSIREEPSAQSATTETEPQTPASETSTPSATTTAAGAPSKPASGVFASSLTSAGVAVGVELQRTDQWLMGGKLWAMTIDGKPDNVTDKPKVQLIAVKANGSQTAIAEIAASEPKGAATIQGNFTVPVPAGTVKLVAVTSLRAAGANGGPALVVLLNDVPVVKTLTLGTGSE